MATLRVPVDSRRKGPEARLCLGAWINASCALLPHVDFILNKEDSFEGTGVWSSSPLH